MAFTSHSSANYEVEVPLTIEYACSPVEFGDGSSISPQRLYSRHATKVYSYKGMTETATKACAAAKRLQYMRRFATWKRAANGLFMKWLQYFDYYEQVASINVRRASPAPVFDVTISVNEIVNIYSTQHLDLSSATDIATLEALFQQSEPPLCYVKDFLYDEPGEESD